MFNMGVEVTRPAFNFEPKYRVTMLTKEEWTRGPGTPPIVNGLIWYTGCGGKPGLESMGNLQEEDTVSL
jgi:hypothetical protein